MVQTGVVILLESGECAQKHPPHAASWSKNGDENDKTCDNTAVLCGKASKFTAKIFNKNPNPLKQKSIRKIHGTN